MKLHCEYVAKYLIPAVRALVATELVKRYGLTQVEVAKRLHVSQPAINYYLNSKRGKLVIDLLKRDQEVMKLVSRIVEYVYSNEPNEYIQELMCELCRYVRTSGVLEKLRT